MKSHPWRYTGRVTKVTGLHYHDFTAKKVELSYSQLKSIWKYKSVDRPKKLSALEKMSPLIYEEYDLQKPYLPLNIQYEQFRRFRDQYKDRAKAVDKKISMVPWLRHEYLGQSFSINQRQVVKHFNLLQRLPRPFVCFNNATKNVGLSLDQPLMFKQQGNQPWSNLDSHLKRDWFLWAKFVKKYGYHKFDVIPIPLQKQLDYIRAHPFQQRKNKDYLLLILSQSNFPLNVLFKLLITSWKEL